MVQSTCYCVVARGVLFDVVLKKSPSARVCLEGLTLRTVQSTGDRSVVSFGTACNYIRLERCEIGGFCGLILPATKEASALESTFSVPLTISLIDVSRRRRRCCDGVYPGVVACQRTPNVL